jgi:tetratricopeptide (TPR) repeat protein
MKYRIGLVALLLAAWLLPQVSVADTAVQHHFDRAVALVETAQSAEDFAAAIKEFEQACGLVLVWADAYHNLAVMQEALGRQRDALGSYQRYLALAPNASDADKVRARVELLERTRMRGPGSSR